MKEKLLFLIFPAFLLSSCLEDTESKQALAELEEFVSELEDQLERAKVEQKVLADELESQAKLKEKIQELEEKSGAADSKFQELQDSLDQEKEAAEKLKKEFEEYRKKYTAKVRGEAAGTKMAEFKSLSGKVFREVEIVEIQDEKVRLKHAGGFSSLGLKDLSQNWINKYQMGVVPEPVVEPEPVLVAEKAEDSADVVEDSIGGDLAMKNDGAAEPKKLNAREKILQEEKDYNEAINAAQKSVVIIKGDQSVGTGFFVKTGGRTYLYTAAHVLSGNTKIEMKTNAGRTFKRFGKVEVSKKVDLLRMEVLEKVDFALTLVEPNQIQINAPIISLGNAGGGSVLTASEGKVLGVGSESFEVSAEIIQGNSGGPILSSDGKTAIGLVTHAIAKREDVWAGNTRFSKVRRFAARLDKPFEFQKVALSSFLEEPQRIARADRITRLIFALSMLTPTKSGLRLSRSINGSYTALQIFQENRGMAAVKNLLKLNEEYGSSRVRFSDIELKKQYGKYYQSILKGSQNQLYSFTESSMTSYHKEMATESVKWRKLANKALAAHIRALNK